MNQEELVVTSNDSAVCELGGLIISVRETESSSAEIVVGRPGLPNVSAHLQTGDTVLFESVDGMFEARLMRAGFPKVRLLVSQISRAPGILGGFADQDQSNSAFEPDEIERIARSIDAIADRVREQFELEQGQLEYISRKLAEMNEASSRLGRKDWMNLAIGTLTGVVINAPLSKDAAKAFMKLASDSLEWLFAGGIQLLS